MISRTVLSRRACARGRWKSFTATSRLRFLSMNSQVSATAPRPIAFTALCEACTIALTPFRLSVDLRLCIMGQEGW